MAGQRYEVRIPPWAREAFAGKSRLSQRFKEAKVGEAWVCKIQSQIAALRAGAEAASIGIERTKDLSLRSAAGLWLAEADVRPSTMSWYKVLLKAHILPHLADMPLSRIDRVKLLEYMDRRRQDGASQDSLSRDITILRAILNWGKDRGYKTDASAWKVAKPKTTPTFTRQFDPDAVQQFLEAIDDPRDRAILEVAAQTGMRAGELRAFDCSWIRWDEARISIPHDQAFSPKGRKPRSVPLSHRLEGVLIGWLGSRREGIVFPPKRTGASGTGVAQGPRLRDVMRRAREISGVPIRGIHDLRHYYISRLAYLGRPPREVQEIAGHSHIATTQRYMHVSPNYLAEARAALDRAEVATEMATAPSRRRRNKVTKIRTGR